MKTLLVYVCTPGVGENIQVLPALWEWNNAESMNAAEKVVMLCPPAQEPIFTGVKIAEPPATAELVIDAQPHAIGWMHNGNAVVDAAMVHHLEKLKTSYKADGVNIKCRSGFHPTVEIPTWLVIEGKHSCPAGFTVPMENKQMLNGACAFPSSPLALADCMKWFPAPAEMGDITVCFGSHEKMRRIPPSVFGKLVVCLIKHGHVPNLIAPDEAYISFIRSHLKGVPHPTKGRDMLMEDMLFATDDRSAESLKEAAFMLAMSKVVVSPDSGTAHIAAAYGVPLVFLGSREPASEVFSAELYADASKFISVDPGMSVGERPPCNMDCRGIVGATAHVPSGYPWNLACSKLPCVPCLSFNDDFIEKLCELVIGMAPKTTPLSSAPKPKAIRLKKKHAGGESSSPAKEAPAATEDA